MQSPEQKGVCLEHRFDYGVRNYSVQERKEGLQGVGVDTEMMILDYVMTTGLGCTELCLT